MQCIRPEKIFLDVQMRAYVVMVIGEISMEVVTTEVHSVVIVMGRVMHRWIVMGVADRRKKGDDEKGRRESDREGFSLSGITETHALVYTIRQLQGN